MVMAGSIAFVATDIGANTAPLAFYLFEIAKFYFNIEHLGFTMATLGEFQVVRAIRTKRLFKPHFVKHKKRSVSKPI